MNLIFKTGKLLSMAIFLLTFLVSCGGDDDEPLPAVVASFTQEIDQATGTVTFTNTSQNATSYAWNFGDGNNSTTENPTQTYSTNGDYTVTLTASNAAGDTDTASATITINVPDTGGGDFDSGLLTNGDFEAGVEPWIGNAANVQEDGGNSFNFANVEAAGNVFDVNLSQVVEITQGTNYILKFDASSDRERTMLAGIGLNEAPFTNSSVSVNLTATTQTYELQLAAADFGGANSRVLFDMGGEVGVVVIDNVSLVEGGDGSDSDTTGGGGSDFDSGLLTNGDFEAGVEPWIGNAANVQEDGGNSFNFADVQAAGNVFDVNLSQVVEITQGTNYILKFDASSDRERTMLAGIGLNEDPWTNTSVTVNLTAETQSYELQLSAADFGGANSRVLFDMGGEVGVVVIDNVSLVEGGDGSDSDTTGGGGSDFDSGLLTNGDFEAGVDPWIGNAANVQEDGGNSFNFADVQAAGNVFDVNLSQVVEITQGTNYILKFDASSDRERTMLAGIGLNEPPFTNSSVSVNLTTTTQTYELQLAAADFGGANSRVLFDMGGEVGVVVIDNVSLVVGGDGSDSNPDTGGSDFDSGLLTNGDFEAGVDPWIGNAANVQEDGGNSFNFADVQAAGNVFDVNLSQVVEITQGTNYILKFDASSDRERTMLAGIGLNEPPFTNNSVSVNLTTTTQTYELQLAAADFGGANSRVLFDMGGEVGVVVIDNVSLVVDTSGGGSTADPGYGESFDAADSINGWERVADANTDEASVTWVADAGNPDGAMRLSGTNPVDTAGKAYIFQTVAPVTFGGATSATLTFDLKLEGDLTAAAVQLQTELMGPGVINTFDLQNDGLNNSTWTTYTVEYNGVMDGNFRMQLNLAAGAVVGAGGTVLVDNISLVAN